MSTVDEDIAGKARAEREAAESAARKAAHEESAARIADAKAAAEFEEWKSNAGSRQRTAELAAEATQLDNLAKFQTVVGAATPELKGLARGKTTAPDDVLYSTLLTTKALSIAASKVAKVVKATNSDAYRVFLTSDPDLLSRDAQLRGLSTRLATLTRFLTELPDPSGAVTELAGGVALGAATAAAKLIPGMLELFAANRTLTAKSITLEDGQALSAVAGALAAAEGNDFLLLDDTRFLSGNTTIQRQRDALEAAILTLLTKVAAEETKPAPEQDAAWLAQTAAVIKSAQDALAAVDTVPAGQVHSPLAAAMAIELIRESDARFILVVQPVGGSATQLINDRPLAMKDPIYLAASLALNYRLIERKNARLVAAGVVVGTAQLKGIVGSTIDLDGLE